MTFHHGLFIGYLCSQVITIIVLAWHAALRVDKHSRAQ
jgi:hypothetical protein